MHTYIHTYIYIYIYIYTENKMKFLRFEKRSDKFLRFEKRSKNDRTNPPIRKKEIPPIRTTK